MAKKIKNYINGQWVVSKTSQFLPVFDPGKGKAIAQVPLSTKEEVNRAGQAAQKAFKTWS